MDKNRILQHLLFWIVYFIFKVNQEFTYLYPAYEELTGITALKIAFGAQLSLLPARMIFTYWILRVVLIRPRELTSSVFPWLKLFFGLIISIVLFRLTIVYIALPHVYGEIPEHQPLFNIRNITSTIIDLFFVGGIAAAISLYRKHYKTREREQVLHQEKLASELKFLRQQTNPHFLFNTLNNLYGLARRESPTTAQALLQLSKLMRYMLYDASVQLIALQKEIEILYDYIGLEKLRYGSRLKIALEIEGDIDDKKIAPLLLLPLVENAFKHGAGESTQNPCIHITLSCRDSNLYFKVVNSVEQVKRQEHEGIGLSNLKRQLALQYPDHRFQTFFEGLSFQAVLEINLNIHEGIKLLDHRR